ncbi:MAG: 2-hydroxyglutaryl-CoA dehydratase [Syntrophomonadaceae bacterium]|nr:2-hydroxyglutaryl-CoA dehydratase [Syntrophomonadaceae bacterium]
MRAFLGIDVGSVTTKMVLMDDKQNLLDSLYLRTQGQPTAIVQKGLKMLQERLDPALQIAGVGTTGSGRLLAGAVCGADVVKNEITAHAVAASTLIPEVKTILEIGGQDSKIIILRQGIVTDFAMNTVCAAGTGSFLDHQAARLNLPIEAFGPTALQAKNPVRIAGRCAVFAESDLIHKQQIGCSLPDLLSGLCEALVRNYLNNVGKGKEILPPVVFQGGVAANQAMRRAFEKALQLEIIIPPHYEVMGAIGAGLMAQEEMQTASASKFRGFDIAEQTFTSSTRECNGCPNLCEVVTLKLNNQVLAHWGDRCGKWQTTVKQVESGPKLAAG